MPKISVHGGASNAAEPGYFERQAEVAAADDGPTVELTRAEDPHAPAPRPGEHTAFFVGEQAHDESDEPEPVESNAEPAGEPAADETTDAPRKTASKRQGGQHGSGKR